MAGLGGHGEVHWLGELVLDSIVQLIDKWIKVREEWSRNLAGRASSFRGPC